MAFRGESPSPISDADARRESPGAASDKVMPIAVEAGAAMNGGVPSAQVVLICATVLVDALVPLLQEQASKRQGFESSSMVLAETMSYFLGGLFLAICVSGISGVRRCIRPARYVAFLPASFAFSSSNFLTYIAVRGLGASQFYLLAQTRVVLLAVILRFWNGVRQPPLAWLAMVQLAVGVVVLVWYKSTNSEADTCSIGPFVGNAGNASSMSFVALHGAGAGKLSTRMAKKLAEVAAERTAFIAGLLSLFGVVLTSGCGFLYLEWQLKAHSQDPLYVQLHQMNSFGAAASLIIHLFHHSGEEAAAAPSQQMAASAGLAALAANATAAAAELAATTTQLAAQSAVAAVEEAADAVSAADASGRLPISWPQLISTLTCIVARGMLGGSVLKQLDSIAKGLIDVTAIVFCTALQILMDPSTANGTILGLECLMLLSILSYVLARGKANTKTAPMSPPPSFVPSRDLATSSGWELPGAGSRRPLPKVK